MADSDSDKESVHVEPLPNYRVKFTDMPKELEEIVARSKFSLTRLDTSRYML